MAKSAAGRPAAASASRTIWTCSANLTVGVEPAPKKPWPSRTARRSATGPFAPNHSGGCGFWNGLGSIGASRNCQNSPSKVTRGCVHSAFISAIPSVNRATYRSGVHPEGGERPHLPAGADSDVDPAAAELVQRGQALGQVHRAVQGGHEHHAAQPHPLGARGRVGHRFERAELRRRPEHVLLRPRAVEAKLLGASEIAAIRGRVELTVREELGYRDRELHSPHRIPAGYPGCFLASS